MAYICEFTVGEHSIQIGAEQIVRNLAFGTNWSKIRIGVQYYFNCNLTPYSLTVPGFYCGVCKSGLAYWDDACISALFISSSIANSATYTAGPAPYIGTTNNYTLNGYQKVGSTVTTLSPSTSYAAHRASCSSAFRSAGFFDITRISTTTATVQGWAQTNSTDQTTALFRAALENEASPTSMTSSAAIGTGLTGTTDWDCIFVAWQRSAHTLNIFGLSVVRFA